MVNTTTTPVIIALDFGTQEEALAFVDKVSPKDCRLKVGLQLYTKYGASFVQLLQTKGFDVFLDLKFHDIPATVKGAVTSAAELGCWMMNVHALGGLSMLQQAKEALEQQSKDTLLIGVTILTSMSPADTETVGLGKDLQSQVIRLSALCKQAGLDGVVCSPNEASLIKQEFGQDFLTVTPGIRFTDGQAHDQKRIMTPQQALESGADFLVMGRSLTHSQTPQQLLQQIQGQA